MKSYRSGAGDGTIQELVSEFLQKTAVMGSPSLWYWQGNWYQWSGSHYQLTSSEAVDNEIFKFLMGRRCLLKHSTIRDMSNLLRVSQFLNISNSSTWIDEKMAPDPRGLFVVKNGMLSLENVRRPKLLPHDPGFFCLSAANYQYAKAAICDQWKTFIDQLWPHGDGSIETLQEWFGYCLLPDTSQQKILTIIGPPRSGKSTIGRVLTELLGTTNVAAPSIRSLSGCFGLWGLLDKSLAIIPDATLPTPCPALEELLKSISGEDAVDIQRKGMAPLTGIRLPTRLMMLANELPAFRDPSGALERRMLILKTHRSFLGKEDIRLTDKLMEELPGILNWAIEGLKRLRGRGHFRTSSTTVDLPDILPALPDSKRVRRIIVQYENPNRRRRRRRRNQTRHQKKRVSSPG